MKAAFPYIDDFVPAGTLASLETLGELLAGARMGTRITGRAVTFATTVSPSTGILPDASTIRPPSALDDHATDPTTAQPLR
jgi:hypothetical protein